MTAIFEKLLEMSLTAACVILVVLVIRLLLRKAPRKYSYALWSVAAFRLVCPVSFKSVFSIFRFARVAEQVEIQQTIDHTILDLPYDIGASQAPSLSPPVTVTMPPATVTVPPTVNVETLPEPETVIDMASAAMDIAAIIWCVGMIALVIYGVVSYMHLRQKMANAVLLEENVYQSDRVRSPFILGFVRPKIYLPFGLTAEQQRYVLAHERYHLRRLDHIIRPVAFLILAAHWFDPLVWVAYYLMGRDMEMSCDEKVLGGGENIRKAYSITLLSFAANRRFPSPSPLAFGETGVKSRIKNALNWKKPRLWVTIAAVVVVAVVLVACAADPKDSAARAEVWEWMSTVTAEDVTGVEVAGEGETGVIYGGESKYLDPLGKQAVQVLVDKLNAVPEEALQEASEEDWRLSLIVDCGEEQYILRLSDDQMGLDYNGDIWIVEDDALDLVARNFVANVLGTDLVYKWETYETVECLYLNSLSAVAFSPEWGKGTPHKISKNYIIAYATPGTYGPHMVRMGDWEPLTKERWDQLFWEDPPLEFGQLIDPMIRTAGYRCYLMDTGGELWLVDTTDAEEEYVWAVYRLEQPYQLSAYQKGYYQSTECVYMTLFSSWIPINGDSGYYYHVTDDQISLIGKDDLVARPYDANGGWEALTEERWRELESEEWSFADLWGQLKEYEAPRIRTYGEGNWFLLDLDGELWIGRSGSHPDGSGYIWELYRLEKLTEEPPVQSEYLTSFWADLTHDGIDELVTVSYEYESMTYPVVVSEVVTGNVIWKEADVSTFHMGYKGLYLYEKDGLDYLLRWTPTGYTGGYTYGYKVFHLSDSGEEVELLSNTFAYDTNSKEQILAIDIEGLRAYGEEINALLADSVVIIDTNEGKVSYSSDGENLSLLWECPADDWAEKQQAILEEEAQRQANTLNVFHADLNHDDRDEDITILKGDYEIYTLEVSNNGYHYWSTELHRTADFLVYMLYEEDGKEYLAQFGSGSGQGIGLWYYRIFSIGPESVNVLYENTLEYHSISYKTLMGVDLDAIVAFEKEVNTRLKDAKVIAGIFDGEFTYCAGEKLSAVFRWDVSEEVKRLEEQKAYWGEKRDALYEAAAPEIDRLLQTLGGSGVKYTSYLILDEDLTNKWGEVYVSGFVTEYDEAGSWLAEYSNVPMRLTFVDGEEKGYLLLSDCWVREKGQNFNPDDDVFEEFTDKAAQMLTDEEQAAHDAAMWRSLLAEQAAIQYGWYDVAVAEGVDAPGAAVAYAASYIRNAHPDASGGEITGLERVDTAAMGTTTGYLTYRLSYRLLQNRQWVEGPSGEDQVCLVLFSDWSSSSLYYWACGHVTEGEIQTVYSTQKMLEQYGDRYLAATLEIARQWQGES